MRSLFLFILFCWSFFQINGQDRGIISINYGTVLVYANYGLSYETPDLLKTQPVHAIRPYIGFGGWTSRFFNKNSGIQSHLGLNYTYGKDKHRLDIGSGLILHGDQSLTGKGLTYIGHLYSAYIGYRFHPISKPFILKIGTGYRTIFQLGIGWTL